MPKAGRKEGARYPELLRRSAGVPAARLWIYVPYSITGYNFRRERNVMRITMTVLS
jgi:hypothetical protein